MSNKLILILLAGLLTLSLDAQSFRSRRRSRQTSRQSQTTSAKEQKDDASAKKRTSSTEKKQSSKKNTQAASRFNKPALTLDQVNAVLDTGLKKRLLECKISAKLPGRKKTDDDTSEDEDDSETDGKPEADGKKLTDEKTGKNVFISRLDFAILMSGYSSLIGNFELTEITRIPLNWYQQYQNELSKFGPIINEMTIALRSRSNGRYAAAVQKFKAHQAACLQFLKQKPPRISKEQYEALVLKNTQIRRRNYLKQQEEKRRAALQRQQEQLKQLQQKSQGKNQGNKTTGQGAGK